MEQTAIESVDNLIQSPIVIGTGAQALQSSSSSMQPSPTAQSSTSDIIEVDNNDPTDSDSNEAG